MHSIFSRFHCKFNYPPSSPSSWHRLQAKERGAMERFVHSRTGSIPGRGGFSIQMRNFGLRAMEKDESARLETAAAMNERVGENSNAFVRDVDFGGSTQDLGSQPSKPLPRNKELVQRLKRYGASGVLSYGLLNTVYYIGTFLFVWLYVAPAAGGMGYASAAQRFLKILAVVWAGSQVTKLPRAAGALALAPFVDRGLSRITKQFKFKSRGQAFGTIIAMCVGLVVLLFVVITLLWA